jgi:hypothetical protein
MLQFSFLQLKTARVLSPVGSLAGHVMLEEGVASIIKNNMALKGGQNPKQIDEFFNVHFVHMLATV